MKKGIQREGKEERGSRESKTKFKGEAIREKGRGNHPHPLPSPLPVTVSSFSRRLPSPPMPFPHYPPFLHTFPFHPDDHLYRTIGGRTGNKEGTRRSDYANNAKQTYKQIRARTRLLHTHVHYGLELFLVTDQPGRCETLFFTTPHPRTPTHITVPKSEWTECLMINPPPKKNNKETAGGPELPLPCRRPSCSFFRRIHFFPYVLPPLPHPLPPIPPKRKKDIPLRAPGLHQHLYLYFLSFGFLHPLFPIHTPSFPCHPH